MSREPFTPLTNIPWIRWLDRTELPSLIIGLAVFLAFLPLYNFNALMPRMPLSGGVFPPALALTLVFLLQLTRGANRDLLQLIGVGKLPVESLQMIAAGKTAAWAELGVGILVGTERVYSQVMFEQANVGVEELLTPGGIAVCFAIIGYTVVQIHLLAFCVRQVVGFRRVASSYQVDLMRPELNNALSNPMIRFLLVGVVTLSFGLLLYEIVPYTSLQRRLLVAALVVGFVWAVLFALSMVPLMILKSRIAVAKSMEIAVVRSALAGDFSGAERSQFGDKLTSFSPGDLMYYEDRIKNIWEWPIEAQIRRIILFGLLPPLTWILAAAVEVVFETLLVG